MKITSLIGAGDRIMALALPAGVLGLAANARWPAAFAMDLGVAGTAAGAVLLALGVPMWLGAVYLLLRLAPKGELITGGPFALVLHPIYTSVALLVLPGVGLVFDSWLGFAVGLVLYAASRLFAPIEERELAARFPRTYPEYRARVLLPWL